jgi:hypothetical protein
VYIILWNYTTHIFSEGLYSVAVLEIILGVDAWSGVGAAGAEYVVWQ